MGYFSELSIRIQEQWEALTDASDWADRSYPSPVQLLLWRLDDYKEQLRDWIEERRRWEKAYYGVPKSDYKTQYQEWPSYWPPRNPEAFYVLPSALKPEIGFSMEDLMDAIAVTQNRLLSLGCDADAEEERQTKLAATRPLEGQLPLPLAA